MPVGGLGASYAPEREQQADARNKEKLAAYKFHLKAALLQRDLPQRKSVSAQRLEIRQHVVHGFIRVLSKLLTVGFERIIHFELHIAFEPGAVPARRIHETNYKFVAICQLARDRL